MIDFHNDEDLIYELLDDQAKYVRNMIDYDLKTPPHNIRAADDSGDAYVAALEILTKLVNASHIQAVDELEAFFNGTDDESIVALSVEGPSPAVNTLMESHYGDDWFDRYDNGAS